MAEDSSTSKSTKLNGKVKDLALKGIVGAVSLTATAAIPIMVQRALQPPSPTVPASAVPAQVQSAVEQPQADAAEPERRGRGKDRNRDKPEKH